MMTVPGTGYTFVDPRHANEYTEQRSMVNATCHGMRNDATGTRMSAPHCNVAVYPGSIYIQRHPGVFRQFSNAQFRYICTSTLPTRITLGSICTESERVEEGGVCSRVGRGGVVAEGCSLGTCPCQ